MRFLPMFSRPSPLQEVDFSRDKTCTIFKIVLCLFLSIALHLFLYAVSVKLAAKNSQLAIHPHSQKQNARVMGLRLIGAYGVDRQTAAKVIAPTILRLIPVPDAASIPPRASPMPPPELPAADLPQPSPPVFSSILSDPASRPAGELDVADFFPSSMVTVSATALADIDLDTVVRDVTTLPSELELTLLIDEQGNVVDVISYPVEISAQTTLVEKIGTVFKQAKFKPAEIDGRPVKSQLRIVVRSDAISVSP